MKVLIINPPLTLLKNEIKSMTFPLGLAYIAAVLEKDGHDVHVIDSVAQGNEIQRKKMIHLGLDWAEIKKRIKRIAPDAIAISCSYSSQSKNSYRVADIAKQVNPKIKVLMGGAHPSSVPNEVLALDSVDYVVLGEGEESTSQLLKGINPKKIDGIGYKKKKIIINPKTSFIEDLDTIPFPARHLFPMEKYLDSEMGHGADMMRKPITSVITSRGCPYNCIYCSIHSVWGKSYRKRSKDNVVDEIEILVKRYGVKEIHFEDDNLTLDRKRMIGICKEIIKRDLDITWTTPNGVALWTLDKEVLSWMKKAGCYKLCFGIESGDKSTQRFIRKMISLKKAKKIIREANKIGIWTHGFFIIGFPYERMRSIKNTSRFSVKCDVDFASYFIATPYPKTDLYTLMKKDGLINDLSWDQLRVSTSTINTKYFTGEELVKIQTGLFKKFLVFRVLNYLNPVKFWYRIKRFRRIDDIKFILRYFKRFLQIIS